MTLFINVFVFLDWTAVKPGFYLRLVTFENHLMLTYSQASTACLSVGGTVYPNNDANTNEGVAKYLRKALGNYKNIVSFLQAFQVT